MHFGAKLKSIDEKTDFFSVLSIKWISSYDELVKRFIASKYVRIFMFKILPFFIFFILNISLLLNIYESEIIYPKYQNIFIKQNILYWIK